MPKLEEFEKWVEDNFDSQDEAATAIGTTQTTISKWIRGKQAISKPFQKKLTKMKYTGPFGVEEGEPDYVTRAEFDELFEAAEDCVVVIRALLQSLPEGSRPLALPKRFR